MTKQDRTKTSETDRLQSVRRALAVLEALAARPDGATPKELSQALSLHLSTTYRLLNTLVAAGYAARAPNNGLFRLGSRVAYLNHGYLTALRPPVGVVPLVHALQVATGETAMLTQLEGDNVVVTVIVAGSKPDSHPSAYVGIAVPAHALAAGRVLLAALPTARLERYLERQAGKRQPPFPLLSPAGLRADLARIRATGYALDRGDIHPGVCCVAAPVLVAARGMEAAIAVVAPCARFQRDETTLIRTVLAVARAIDALPAGAPAGATTAGASHEPGSTTQAEIEAAVAAVAAAMSRVG